MHITQASKRGHSKQPNQTGLITLQTLTAGSVEREEREYLTYCTYWHKALCYSDQWTYHSHQGTFFIQAQTQSHQTSRHIVWGHTALGHIYQQYIGLRALTDSICVRLPWMPVTTAKPHTHYPYLRQLA